MVLGAVLPISAVAAGAPQNLKQLIEMFTGLVNPLIGLLSSLAVLFFMWGVVQYILYAGDEKKKLSAKSTMGYGILGLFVLFSFWGIVQFLKNALLPN